MKYAFGAIFAIIKRIFRLFVYQITLPYSNLVNKTFILSMFLLLRCFYMDTKLRLLKNIVIYFFVILLACINFVYIYLILFSNEKQLLSSILGILIMPTMISSYLTSFPTYLLLLSLNFINLKPL